MPQWYLTDLDKEIPMDVFKIGSGNAPKAPEGGSVDQARSKSRRGESLPPSDSGSGDVYAGSSSARQIDALVDRLVAGPDGEVRSDLVDQFRALLQVVEFDSPENAERAAAALLGTNDA